MKASVRDSGFTLVELLVVIAIIVGLMTLVVTGGARMKVKAQRESTKSLVQRITLALEDYKGATGTYPPDGIDSRVRTEEGTPLQSGAALTYALTREVELNRRLPDGTLEATGTQQPVLEVSDDELYVPDEDDPEAREIVDSWNNSLHYDNLAGGAEGYSEQSDGSFHLEEPETHGVDPREEEGVSVFLRGPQNGKTYDVWSHGPNGHTPEEVATDTIGNWKLPAGDDGG